ncbi:MAG: hypothetical protein AAGG07_00990 [Planctomycetota bacterium]
MRSSARAAVVSLVAGLSAIAGSAQGQLSTAFSYQGVLEDGGAPANGAYDFQFRLFTAELGGVQVGPVVSSLNQAVTGGLIQQQPDFGSFFEGQRLWIEVSVRNAGSGAYTALPRREILATPNAQFAIRAAQATFAETSGTTLTEAFDNGNELDTTDQLLTLSDSINGGAIGVDVGDSGGFNSLQFFGDDSFFYIAEDADGGGTFMQLGNAPNSGFGFVVDGNDGANNATVFIDGTSSSSFRTASSGNASVNFPQDAIGSFEILDEPGIASASASSSLTLTPTSQTILSQTITVPSAGFLVAVGSVQVFADHVTGSDTAINLTIDDDPSTIFPRFRTEIEASVGTDISLGRVIDFHRVFQVSAGSTTIYATASATGGGDGTDVVDRRLTLMFFPTSYGTVAGRPTLARTIDDEATLPGPPMSSASIEAEKAASVAANVARIEAELAAMKAQVEAINAERAKNRGQ